MHKKTLSLLNINKKSPENNFSTLLYLGLSLWTLLGLPPGGVVLAFRSAHGEAKALIGYDREIKC